MLKNSSLAELRILTRSGTDRARFLEHREPARRWRYERQRQTDSNGCPVPQSRTGLYKTKGNVNGAQLKLAATDSKATSTAPA
jgi:hypothetical protein